VQAPNKYELVINLKTATVLGIEVPLSLLTHVDDVIGYSAYGRSGSNFAMRASLQHGCFTPMNRHFQR